MFVWDGRCEIDLGALLCPPHKSYKTAFNACAAGQLETVRKSLLDVSGCLKYMLNHIKPMARASTD